MTDWPLRLVAIDLGAESGRAVVGTFDGGRLVLQDVHRFANVPVRLAGVLHWDFLRLFGDVTAGLRRAAAGGPVASVGADTWGVDFGLLDALRAAGCRDYSIYERDDDLFGVFEVDDFDRFRAIMDASPVNARWQADMAGLIDPLTDPATGFHRRLEEVFRLD